MEEKHKFPAKGRLLFQNGAVLLKINNCLYIKTEERSYYISEDIDFRVEETKTNCLLLLRLMETNHFICNNTETEEWLKEYGDLFVKNLREIASTKPLKVFTLKNEVITVV